LMAHQRPNSMSDLQEDNPASLAGQRSATYGVTQRDNRPAFFTHPTETQAAGLFKNSSKSSRAAAPLAA
jgi:hypothetical protein